MPATSTSFFACSDAWAATFSRGVKGAPASGWPASAFPAGVSGACASAAEDASSAAAATLVTGLIGVKLGTRFVGVDHFAGNLLHRGAADHHEEPAFVRQRARPAELGEHVLEGPVVLRGAEQVAAAGRLGGEQRVRKGAHVLDAVLTEPPLHFAERVAVLLDVAVLVAQPGLAARRLGAALAQHGIERDPAESREPRHASPQPVR